MPKLIPVVKRVTAAADDATFTDSADVGDTLVATLDRDDSLDAADSLDAITLTPADSVGADDAIVGTTLDATAADTVKATAFYVVSALTIRTSEDCYLDRADAGNAHDGATALCKVNTAVVNDDKKAYVAFNLTGLVGLTAGNNPDGSVTLRVSHNGATAQNLSWEAYRQSAKPFEEETATWTGNEPISGGTGMTESNTPISIANGAAADYVFTIANISDAFGQWVWLRLLGNTGVGGDLITFTIVTQEGANPPTLLLEAGQ